MGRFLLQKSLRSSLSVLFVALFYFRYYSTRYARIFLSANLQTRVGLGLARARARARNMIAARAMSRPWAEVSDWFLMHFCSVIASHVLLYLKVKSSFFRYSSSIFPFFTAVSEALCCLHLVS